MKTNWIKQTFLAGLAVVGLMGGTAIAQTVTTTFQVSASVAKNCFVSANNLAFGAYDGSSATPLDANTTIGVRCTKNTTFTVDLDAGVTPGATVAQRRMTNGTDDMLYNLYTDGTYGTVWGDGTNGTGQGSGTGAGLGAPQEQTLTVYGRIPGSQGTLSVGSYTETTITVTVNY